MTLPPELIERVVVTGLYLVVLGTSIFVLQAFGKHALKSLSWTCLDSPAGQVLLRGVPLLGGATVGVSIFGALWPEPIAAMLGLIAGAQARGLHRAGRSIGSGLAHRLLVTSEARGGPGTEDDSSQGPPWAAMVIPFGDALTSDVLDGAGIVVLAAILATLGIAGALLPRLLRTLPAARSEADVAHDRAAEVLRRAEEERGRDVADMRAAEGTREIEAALSMPTETPEQRRARIQKAIEDDRKRRGR